uniref:Uncharacterized protein n=1 Tax=Fagus sylvatica TaxID=28930 RepID=A0A2N9H9P6_FAGSY
MEPSAERLVEFPVVIFAFAIKWREKQVDPDLASKKSGWSLLKRKFDELLSFVQLIAKRNTEDENQRKEDDKDTSEAEPEGHSNTNATPPRPPTPPKPEGKDSQLDSKIDSLEEKIRLIQGLNSFGNTDFSSMSWFPNMTVPPKFKAPEFEKYNGRGDPMIHLQMYCRKMAPYADNEPLLIQTFQDTLTGNAAEVVLTVEEDLSLEGTGGYLLGSIRFFVDLIPVGDRIEDALKTKKIVDMTALMALAEQAAKKAPTKRKEGDVQMIGRNNGRPRQVLPTFTMQPIQPRPIQAPAPTQAPAPAPAPQMPARPEGNQPNDNSGPQRRDFNPNSACDFHFGEVGHTVENCGQLRHRVQDLIDHGVLKFEGLPNITTNPLPKHPEGGVNMVEVEEGNEESIAWRRLFYTLEKQKHITPLDAPPGPSTGDSCEYHSGARGHSLDCCEEFKKKVTDLMENGIVGREEIPSKGSRQPDDPSEFDWYAQRSIWMTSWKTRWISITYKMKKPIGDTSWRMILMNGEMLISPNSSNSPCRNKAAAWFYQLRNLTGWDDLVRVFLERYRFNPHSILEYLGLKKDEEPYIIPDPGGEEEEKDKPPPAKEPDSITSAGEGEEPIKTPPSGIIITTTAEEEDAGPMVEGLSIHTIAGEEDSTTTPPTRHCQQGEEIIPTKKSNYQVTSFEALERQDEGSKPNIEELEIVNLANEGEEPREVKIGTRCAAEQKEALIALLREFHEIFAWSYQDMPGLDTDIVVHKIPAKARMQARQTSTATDEARSHFEDQGRGGKAIEGRFPKHSNLFGLGSQYSPGAEEGRKTTNVVFSFMDGFSGTPEPLISEPWSPLFHDMIHHEIEVYVDDMIAKSRTAQDHLTDLRKLFQRLKKYQLRLNPNKCAFGVTSGKLLGFIVSGRGIEIDPAKVQAIRSMPAPKTEKEIRSFLGRINYIARFIAQLTATCEPLFKLLRKDVKIKWTEDCQKAFDKIKEYLLNPPILVPPTPGRPLILYLTVQEASMGCMLGQQDETGKKEQAIYYLSKKFTEPETRYLLVEKTCCALAWASKKLRQYMLYYTTWRSRDKAIADYLADYPSEQLELMDSRVPRRRLELARSWYRQRDNKLLSLLSWGFDCTNNMTEYEACIVGLQAALEFGAYELEVFGDSLLIVSQTNGEWQARDPKLIPYQRYISRLVPKFKYVTFTYTPRAHNHFADALATLASLIKLVEGDDVRPLRIETRDIPAYCVCIEECMNVEAEIDDKPWYYDIKRFIQDREYPSRATENEKKHVQTCHKCQMYQNSKNAPPQYLHTMASPWPFSAWGMDVIGAITPKASNGHEFILVAIDYFTKWVEACSFKNVHSSRGHPLCQQFKIQHHNSAPYRPKMNGAVEAANKNVKKILSKMTETYKDWHEHLPYAFTAGRSGDPFFENPVTNSAGRSLNGPKPRYEQLNFIDEKRLAALCHGQLYQRRIERAYNKKARPRTFQPGDLVLKKRNMALIRSTREVRTII